MVEPLSIAIGAGGFVIVASSYYAAYLRGKLSADRVNMNEVTGYLTRQQAVEALQQDVDDTE